jgi:hypothetical protein
MGDLVQEHTPARTVHRTRKKGWRESVCVTYSHAGSRLARVCVRVKQLTSTDSPENVSLPSTSRAVSTTSDVHRMGG